MSDDEAEWVAQAAVAFDCLIFVWRGRFGLQPVLFPWREYGSLTSRT